jgi:hypothetical protein
VWSQLPVNVPRFRVAQASSLSFSASRRKPPATLRPPFHVPITRPLRLTTKFGATPNFTRATRVTPTQFDRHFGSHPNNQRELPFFGVRSNRSRAI